MGSKFLFFLGLSVAIVVLLVSSDVAARDVVEPAAEQNAEAAVGKPAEPGKNAWLSSFAEQVKNEKGKTDETGKEGEEGEEAKKAEEGEKEEEEEMEEKEEEKEEEQEEEKEEKGEKEEDDDD